MKIEADIKATTGTLKITPDENVWQYCMLFLPDDEYQQLLPFVGGDESLLQWFTASFLAAMQFGAQTLEGPVEFALEDSYYLLIRQGIEDYCISHNIQVVRTYKSDVNYFDALKDVDCIICIGKFSKNNYLAFWIFL